MKCCLCKKEIPAKGTWTQGNNAQPVADGRCCDVCDQTIVIPTRIQNVMKVKLKTKKTYDKYSLNPHNYIVYVERFDGKVIEEMLIYDLITKAGLTIDDLLERIGYKKSKIKDDKEERRKE